MRWSTAWFVTCSLTVAWNFRVLILWFFALVALERIVEHLIHRFKKGGR